MISAVDIAISFDNVIGADKHPIKQKVPPNEASHALFVKQKALRGLFARDGQRVELSNWSDDEETIICYPRVLDISFEEGIYVDKEARTITIDEITNISINLPKVSFNIACSKGTYIRSIARDLGNQLECGGHLSRLIRTSQEKFTINSAISIDEAREEDIIPLENAFDNLNTITLNQLDADAFINGVPLKLKIDHSDLLRVYDPSKKFIAIGKKHTKVTIPIFG